MDKVIGFSKLIFYTSVFLLIVISLFPGSLLGFVLYSDLGKQPNLIDNPLGTVINHFIYYFLISLLGLLIYLRKSNFKRLVFSLFFLSILLEILQLVVPNRAFEILDLSANFVGVLTAFLLVKIYKYLGES